MLDRKVLAHLGGFSRDSRLLRDHSVSRRVGLRVRQLHAVVHRHVVGRLQGSFLPHASVLEAEPRRTRREVSPFLLVSVLHFPVLDALLASLQTPPKL